MTNKVNALKEEFEILFTVPVRELDGYQWRRISPGITHLQVWEWMVKNFKPKNEPSNQM